MADCVREMHVDEEIENLDIPKADKERIIRKYREEKAYSVENHYRELENKQKLVSQQAVEIKALVGYIAMTGL